MQLCLFFNGAPLQMQELRASLRQSGGCLFSAYRDLKVADASLKAHPLQVMGAASYYLSDYGLRLHNDLWAIGLMMVRNRVFIVANGSRGRSLGSSSPAPPQQPQNRRLSGPRKSACSGRTTRDDILEVDFGMTTQGNGATTHNR